MPRIPQVQKTPYAGRPPASLAAPSAPDRPDSSSWAGEPDLAAVFALVASLGIGALIFTVMSIVALHG